MRRILSAIALVAFVLAQAQASPRRRSARAGSPRWMPQQGATWQIQFAGALDMLVPASIYDVDGIDTSAEDIAALHNAGRKVICYINAGAWEEWRQDAASFPSSVIGNPYAGWPGEKWLDIRRIEILGPILGKRLDLCRAKGCDAIDPDNLDGYTNETGFPLTAEDQLAFNRFLAREAHARNLSIGLKNDFGQAADLADDFDFAVTESCFLFNECELLLPFLKRRKAVFDIEYTDTAVRFDQACIRARELAIDAILKNRLLDGWRAICPGG